MNHENLFFIFLNNAFSMFQLVPTEGMIRKNSHLRMARYHQHLHELLDLDISPLDYMLKSFPEVKEREEMRKIIGRYGLTGRQQVSHFYFSIDYIFIWGVWLGLLSMSHCFSEHHISYFL